MNPSDIAIAKQNGAIIDLSPGDAVKDGEGVKCIFRGYGDNAPLYVNLQYQHGIERLPNAELKRVPR